MFFDRETVLVDQRRKSFGLCRDFDSHGGWVFERPQKKPCAFSYIARIFAFACFGLVNA